MRNNFPTRFAAGICALFMLIVLNCPISNADVAWEPEDNFYRRHADECRLVRMEDMIANGPGGSVTIWESPVSDREAGAIENGSEVGIEYTYTDKRGYTWGIVHIGGGKAGWVPMDYLVTEPGLKNFINKHRDEYQEYNDRFIPPEGVAEIFFWSYPGSGEVVNRRNMGNDESISIDASYTDKDGLQWGYVTYFQAADGWICMSDPANDQIPVNEEDAADVVMPPEPNVIIKPQPEGINAVIIVAILVVVVVTGTVILIWVLFKKTKAAKATDKSEKT